MWGELHGAEHRNAAGAARDHVARQRDVRPWGHEIDAVALHAEIAGRLAQHVTRMQPLGRRLDREERQHVVPERAQRYGHLRAHPVREPEGRALVLPDELAREALGERRRRLHDESDSLRPGLDALQTIEPERLLHQRVRAGACERPAAERQRGRRRRAGRQEAPPPSLECVPPGLGAEDERSGRNAAQAVGSPVLRPVGPGDCRGQLVRRGGELAEADAGDRACVVT